MAKILLLEPGYSNKYPPLGLMKLAYYHSKIKQDDVFFAKGTLENEVKEDWQRVYVTTLFTFEWKETEKTIDYAISLVDNPNKVYIGGIAATLLAAYIREVKPGINVIEGLLNQKGKIGYEDDDIIDQLPSDYSILKSIKYQYPTEDSYFAYTTRGCGMNCSFCAVKTLEPDYIPRVSIKQQVERVNTLFTEKKDLILMDNNVLKSKFFKDIVDEIKLLGFEKGQKFFNPNTKNYVQRSVDFNQGLDANLITAEKAALLAQLELRPVRIAFDHIQDEEKYVNAVKLCVEAGLREFSNYVLYNSDESSGKGKNYPPDTPEELFLRLQLNVKLQNDLSRENDKISIYSFPMRYIPLNALSRGYIGPGWNLKFLRAIQVMLAPTQGKGVGGSSFFEAVFGTSVEEFKTILVMPERLIGSRGHFPKFKKEDTDEQKELKQANWAIGRELLESWINLYKALPEIEKIDFIECIKDNKFSVEGFRKLTSPSKKKLYLYYFTHLKLFNLFENLDSEEDIRLVKDYCLNECPVMIRDFKRYINKSKPPFNKITGYIKIFVDYGIVEYLKKITRPSKYNKIEDNDFLKLDQSYQWEKDFESINNKISFTNRIRNSVISIEVFHTFVNKQEKRTFLHHLSESQVLDLLNKIENEKDLLLISDYYLIDAPFMVKGLANYIVKRTQLSHINIVGYLRTFGNIGINVLVEAWLKQNCMGENLLIDLNKAFKEIGYYYIDTRMWQLFKDYLDLEVLDQDEITLIGQFLINQNFEKPLVYLKNTFPRFKEKYINKLPSDATSASLIKRAEQELLNYENYYFGSLFISEEV